MDNIMVRNSKLIDAKIYFDNNEPFIKLIYECRNEDSLYKVIIPRLSFPLELKQFPTVDIHGFIKVRDRCSIKIDERLYLNPDDVQMDDGSIAPDAAFICELIEPNIPTVGIKNNL